MLSISIILSFDRCTTAQMSMLDEKMYFLRDSIQVGLRQIGVEGSAMDMICTHQGDLVAMKSPDCHSQKCCTHRFISCTFSCRHREGSAPQDLLIRHTLDRIHCPTSCRTLLMISIVVDKLTYNFGCCAPQISFFRIHMASRSQVSDSVLAYSLSHQ